MHVVYCSHRSGGVASYNWWHPSRRFDMRLNCRLTYFEFLGDVNTVASMFNFHVAVSFIAHARTRICSHLMHKNERARVARASPDQSLLSTPGPLQPPLRPQPEPASTDSVRNKQPLKPPPWLRIAVVDFGTLPNQVCLAKQQGVKQAKTVASLA